MTNAARWIGIWCTAIAAIACQAAPAPAVQAATPTGSGPPPASGGGFSFALGASAGVVTGTATELVFDYPAGRKAVISELIWDFRDVALAGVQASATYGRRLRLNVGWWSALDRGRGGMVDRDWEYPEAESAALKPGDDNWTSEARFPDTVLLSGTVLDANLDVVALRAGAFALRGVVGYRSDAWSWSARGGTFVYSTAGFRDSFAVFPEGQEVIAYRQRFRTPYVGLGAGWSAPGFSADLRLSLSTLVSATDRDYHVLRDVLFVGDYSGGTWVGLGVDAAWAVAPPWELRLGLEYQSFSQNTGDVTVSGSEGRGVFERGGGLALRVATFTLGLGCRY